MMDRQKHDQIGANGKKPERLKGPLGLWLYGALTILGGLALVIVAE